MNDRLPIRDRTLILRVLVPGLEARLRDKMKEMEERAETETTTTPRASVDSNTTSSKEICLDLDGVTCEPTAARNRTLWNFHCDGATYPARLVGLPCPVELHKTHDHAAYYKCADIAQMLIVYEDEMALEEADEKPYEGFPSYYHSGVTPPMKRVVERRFAAREHKAVPPPRAAVADVEEELVDLMDKLSNKDEKNKRKNKVPMLTSATKVLEEVEEEIVDYEPWMDDYGRQPHGVEFDADDQLCSLHPEVWLPPAELQELKQQEQAERKKKQAAQDKKEAKRKDKKQKEEEDSTVKKGIASKKNRQAVDEVTQAAVNIAEGLDLMDEVDDDFFHDLGLDMNFDDNNL